MIKVAEYGVTFGKFFHVNTKVVEDGTGTVRPSNKTAVFILLFLK